MLEPHAYENHEVREARSVSAETLRTEPHKEDYRKAPGDWQGYDLDILAALDS